MRIASKLLNYHPVLFSVIEKTGKQFFLFFTDLVAQLGKELNAKNLQFQRFAVLQRQIEKYLSRHKIGKNFVKKWVLKMIFSSLEPS